MGRLESIRNRVNKALEYGEIGQVTGLKRKLPRSEMFDVISHGQGGGASVEDIVSYTAFRPDDVQMYVDEFKNDGLLELRQVEKKNGELIDLVCFTEVGKSK
jgi:hypothetical protein